MNRARGWVVLFLTAVATNAFAEETNLVAAASVKAGRSLFLKNCAHCHGKDASGDDGPDLRGLRKSDAWIARRIRNGVKGEMTAFGEKFSQADVEALIAYLRSLVSADHGTKSETALAEGNLPLALPDQPPLQLYSSERVERKFSPSQIPSSLK